MSITVVDQSTNLHLEMFWQCRTRKQHCTIINALIERGPNIKRLRMYSHQPGEQYEMVREIGWLSPYHALRISSYKCNEIVVLLKVSVLIKTWFQKTTVYLGCEGLVANSARPCVKPLWTTISRFSSVCVKQHPICTVKGVQIILGLGHRAFGTYARHSWAKIHCINTSSNR